jgi:rare lipoprotein A
LGIVRGMGDEVGGQISGLGSSGRYGRLVCLLVLGISGLALANCSGGNMAGRIDPRYGVAASARAVDPGQPVPKGGGVYRIGKPYEVAGRLYVPEENINYSAVGLASWYGNDFHGRYTANGEIFDMNSISAAHPTLPLPSYVRVTNLANHRSIIVRVNDRGPYVGDRLIDVSVKTAELLGFYGHGVTRVKVDYVGRAPLEGSDDRKLVATLREGKPADAPLLVASNKPYTPAYFDRRPLTNLSARGIPSPPDRPYRLGEGARELPAVQAPTTELAAAARPRSSGPAARAPVYGGAPVVSAVSAYAPGGYDGRSNVMSGRGLY